MKFTIDKNIPLPLNCSELKHEMVETMKDMKPGDSFFILFNKVRTEKACRYTFDNAKAKISKFQFASKKEKNAAGSPGLRIWRLIPPSPEPSTTQPTPKQ